MVGIAGAVAPMQVGPEVFSRDLLAMSLFTVSLFLFGYGFRGPGRINRYEGLVLCLCYVLYTANLVRGVL